MLSNISVLQKLGVAGGIFDPLSASLRFGVKLMHLRVAASSNRDARALQNFEGG
jgi:hypothetical protein